jgi:RimJ/RimL family protein N-acetyltransferase
MDINSIEIKELNAEDADLLSRALLSEKSEYLKHFTPFEFSVDSIKRILSSVVKDKYLGIFLGNKIIGFYMLRGFDDGYEIPAYGVWISSDFSNKGLSTLTLFHAFSICRLNNIKTLMLKVHPENKIAKKLYESLGFVKIGIDKRNDNFIYHKLLAAKN